MKFTILLITDRPDKGKISRLRFAKLRIPAFFIACWVLTLYRYEYIMEAIKINAI